MSDDTLLALVKRNPVRVEEFRSIRGTDQLGERDVDGALMAIKRTTACRLWCAGIARSLRSWRA